MTQSSDDTKEINKSKEVQAPPEAVQRGGVIGENVNQAKWRQTQAQHILEQGESATDLFYDPNFKPIDKAAKFELIDSATESNQDGKTGTFIDYQFKQHDKKTFSLGMDHENDTRTGLQKLNDFVSAAVKRATDPEGQKKYIQDELDKIAGIGRGLTNAKEHTKASAVAGWTALTDGTVATFLAKPNAINDPLFHAVGGAFDAIKTDPNAVNKAMEKVGEIIVAGSERYSNLPPGKQGEFLGETLFYTANLGGTTEGGELALKIADNIATKVDAVATAGFQKSMKAIEEMSATAPELGFQAKQMLRDYTRSLNLTGPELEAAGFPRGYFDGIAEAPDNILMMKGDKGLRGVQPSELLTTTRQFSVNGEIIHKIVLPESAFEAAEKMGIARSTVQEKLDKISHALSVAYGRIGDYNPSIHGNPTAYGNRLHEALRQEIGRDKLLHAEASYLKGQPAQWGHLGTSRIDIGVGDEGKPFTSICLKTLRSKPSAQQERGWANNLPKLDDGTTIPRFYLKLGK
jgi:hypothetical protein